MGLFDRLTGSSEERERRRIRDLGKKAQEKYGDPAARSKALSQLREIGSPEAIRSLLQRFTVKVEPGITDAEDKEYVFQSVTSFGTAALGPLQEFLRSQGSTSWAVRCLEALMTGEELIAVILQVLEPLASEYSRDPEKKVVLINHLARSQDARIAPAVLPFLEDPADDVRIAALGTLVRQADPAAREPIVRLLLEDEAPRVRAAAADSLAELGWNLTDTPGLAERIPDGFVLDPAGKIHRR